MKKIILFALLLSFPHTAFAAGDKAKTENMKDIEGAAPSALRDVLITSNASQNVSLSNVLWYNLNYNGVGTCKVRKMNDTTKASWIAIPVPPGTSFSRVTGKNTAFLNISGCAGTTTTSNGTGNSVLELQ